MNIISLLGKYPEDFKTRLQYWKSRDELGEKRTHYIAVAYDTHTEDLWGIQKHKYRQDGVWVREYYCNRPLSSRLVPVLYTAIKEHSKKEEDE